ncbi:chromosome segregation protein Csm1/Pcs1-domain-containing protein [Rhypophila decipiens]|uniref:Chromosome segregation protein Csm1/Pcs1-domain-containing protein n=1 Tax=Rhypophila decipiens TaxID=261697 RepID=A0AAN7B4X5_9PEZI|nr:chromosome segregation protein Csm1/Pcs1-domain-containing protein [Rhypophila decipiens]
MANAKSRSSQLLELVDSDSDDGLSGGLTRFSAAKPTKAIGANVAHNKNINNRADKVNKTKTAKMPPAKKAARGRQAAAANKVTKPGQKNTTASTRAAANERIAAAAEDQLEEDSRTALIEKSTNVQPKTGRGRKRAAAPATAPEEVEVIVEDVEMEDAPAPAPKASRGRPKRAAAVEEVPDSQPPPPARGRKKGAAKKQPEPVVEEDEEEEEMNETTEIPETQQAQNMTVIEEEEEEEGEAEQLEELLRAQKSSSELLRGRNHLGSAAPPSPSKSRPVVYGSASPSKTSSDPALRRRLGEMTQKYENLEQKYHNLREIAVKEAESNFEKLRKQTDEKSRVADELVASLKAELAAQKEAAKELPRLQKQLEASEQKAQALETKNAQLATSLAESKTEIKALNMKLTAARTAEAAAAAKAAVPGSAVKGGASSRMNGHHNMMTTSNSEAVRQATLKGQKREDLYADLTGLIIRTTTSSSIGSNKDDGVAAGDVIYDCIQTGKNGTLHFKLLEVEDLEGAGEEPQLRYMPQLDPGRDRAMMEILPNFLVDEIEFPRSHVDKFYARVVKALTGA